MKAFLRAALLLAAVPAWAQSHSGGGMNPSASNATFPWTLGGGDATPVYGTGAAQMWSLAKGSNASPVTTAGPLISLNYFGAVDKANCFNNPADTGCTSQIRLNSVGSAASSMVSSNITAYASSASSSAGADAQPLNGIGRITGAGTGYGMGAFLLGSTSSDSGHALGAEISAQLLVDADICVVSYSGISPCDGVWVVPRSNFAGRNLSAGVHIGVADANSKWREGITGNNNSVTDVFVNDQTGAALSYKVGSGLLTIDSAGKLSTASAVVTTGGSAPSLANGTGYILGSATGGLTLGGQGSSTDFQIMNKSGAIVLSVGSGGNAVSGVSYLATGAPFLGTAGTGAIGGSATGGALIGGNGSVNDVTITNKSGASAIAIATGTQDVGFGGGIRATAISTSATVAGSLCRAADGTFIYKVGANCF